MNELNINYYSVVNSIECEINEFYARYGKYPEAIFMSTKLVTFIQKHCKYLIKNEYDLCTFAGILLHTYISNDFEYYVANKRGSLYNFDYNEKTSEVIKYEI